MFSGLRGSYAEQVACHCPGYYRHEECVKRHRGCEAPVNPLYVCAVGEYPVYPAYGHVGDSERYYVIVAPGFKRLPVEQGMERPLAAASGARPSGEVPEQAPGHKTCHFHSEKIQRDQSRHRRKGEGGSEPYVMRGLSHVGVQNAPMKAIWNGQLTAPSVMARIMHHCAHSL